MSLTIDRTSTYTLAKHTPLLKDQQLCGFLNNMDTKEQAVLAQEKQDAIDQMNSFDQQNSFQKVVGRTIWVAGFVLFGVAYSVLDYCLRNNKDHVFNTLFFTSMAGMLSGAIIAGSVSSRRTSLANKLNSSTEEARLLRLQSKVTTLEIFISNYNLPGHMLQAKEAKEYFALNIEKIKNLNQ